MILIYIYHVIAWCGGWNKGFFPWKKRVLKWNEMKKEEGKKLTQCHSTRWFSNKLLNMLLFSVVKALDFLLSNSFHHLILWRPCKALDCKNYFRIILKITALARILFSFAVGLYARVLITYTVTMWRRIGGNKFENYFRLFPFHWMNWKSEFVCFIFHWTLIHTFMVRYFCLAMRLCILNMLKMPKTFTFPRIKIEVFCLSKNKNVNEPLSRKFTLCAPHQILVLYAI